MATFEDLNLIPPLQKAIAEEGYEIPTPIQELTIPPALEGLDIRGCAQTGTGKTAAFALPILNHLASNSFKTVAKRPLVLIIAPTRELAVQIGDSFETYGRHVDISHVLVYGGVSQDPQVKALEAGVHILIATPGRLLDLMEQEFIFLNRLQVLVLDEADRMLDMGFQPELKRIIKSLPIRRQSMFFSATMPDKIIELSEKLLHHPVSVEVSPEKTNVELIDQRVVFAEHEQKKPFLLQLLTEDDVGQAMVFTKTKRGANSIAEYLHQHKVNATAIHGNKSQSARQKTLDSFRANKVQVLVATDVAARGIDVEGITHVINFELPIEPEGYVHRVGRTGRAGSRGIAITLCSRSERDQLREIERLIGFEILADGREPEPLPPSESAHSSDDDSEKTPGGRRNRRHRRSRERAAANRADAPESEEPKTIFPTLKPPRPTAAQRKRDKNKRRPKGGKGD